MRKHTPTICISGVILVLGVIVILINIHPANAQKPQGQEPSNSDHDEVRDAIRRGGYREVAKVKGHYVGNIDPNWDWARFDLETLTRYSAAVVVGKQVRSKSELSKNGRSVNTEYDVIVDRVIKGKISVGEVIEVSLPGGKVDFEDGTSVELITPGFEKMTTSNPYVLFLSVNHDGSSPFILTGGPPGLFELPSDSAVVKAHGRPTDPAVKETKDKPIQSFLEQVRSMAAKWPEPGKCCS